MKKRGNRVKKQNARNIVIDVDAIPSLQPVVKLVRLKLPLINSAIRYEQLISQAKNRSKAKSIKPESKANKTIQQHSSSAKANYCRNNDMVMYAIDLNDKCYAVKVFPTPFDANVSTFDDYLTKSLNDAELHCEYISKGMCNTKRYPEISECDKTSPMITDRISKLLRFELTIKQYHLREKRLRFLNTKIEEALKGNQLEDYLRALDELLLLLLHSGSSLTPLTFKKQPGIVCTLFDLLNKKVDETNPRRDLVKCMTEKAIMEIRQIFEFNGSNKDFMNRFLLEVELFSKMTAHLNVREKYELIVDPVNVIEPEEVSPCL